MHITLPDDILNQISIQLWHARDFDTLFKFALCSKQFAALGLANLYKMQHLAPVKRASEMDALGKNQDEQTRGWAILWRSIILSTMEGKTIFPYCRYIRVLDLQDFTGLLEELNGRFTMHQKTLFTKDLKKFQILTTATASNSRRASNKKLAWDTIPIAVGEEITKHAPFLEELGGELTKPELEKWIIRLPRLKTLRLYDGKALKGCHTTLKQGCPDFKHLYLFNWISQTPDEECAEFLNGIHPNTLESFEVVGGFMKQNSIEALANHCSSLRVLKLHGLRIESLTALPQLKEATLLETVLLRDEMVRFSEHPELFEGIPQWLCPCRNLKALVLQDIESGPIIATAVLLNQEIRLQHLEVSGYDMIPGRKLHEALNKHSSLQSLYLTGDASDCILDDIETLVGSLCNLWNLRKLRIVDISNHFTDSHICMIARALPLLEELWVGGYQTTDTVWGDLANLRNLKVLIFQAMSKFTPEGIMGFVKTLDCKRGMQLEIMYGQDPISNSDKHAIEEEIASKGGSFVFTLWREEEDDSDDSDYD